MGARAVTNGRVVALLAALLVLSACAGPSGAPPSEPSVTVELGSGPFGGPSAGDDTPGTASTFTPVTGSVLAPPTPVLGTDGRVHLAYELQLTQVLGQPATVAAVEVRSGDRVLLRLDGDALAPWIKPFGGDAGSRVLQPGQSGLVWLDVTYAPGEPAPTRLEHRVDVRFANPSPPLVPGSLTETVAVTSVATVPPIRISPPLRGTGWLDGDSCCRLGAHRGAVSPIDGALWAPERYAIDYVRLDPSGRMLTGDPTRIESYPYVGSDVLAVADGPVVGLVSYLPQQPPGANPGGLRLDEYGGNHVVQDLGGGRYAFYAHLQSNNPLNLAVGQRLRRGQVIGKLGNSGNSDAPHLHFHVMDRVDPLAANGLPFVFDTFSVDARVASEEALAASTTRPVPFPLDRAGAGPRREAMPLGLDVMTYPPAP
jgi:hypothetical protein